jgi:hypothetical protein
MNTCAVDIPPVPLDLIKSLDQIKALPPVVLYQEDGSTYESEWYHVYTCDQELTDWIVKHFPVEVDVVEYIVSDRAIIMHTDLGRSQAYNYVLDTGGKNILTEFYNDSRDQLVEQVEYATNQWYLLNVSVPHMVKGEQTRPRVLISVTPKAGVTYKF